LKCNTVIVSHGKTYGTCTGDMVYRLDKSGVYLDEAGTEYVDWKCLRCGSKQTLVGEVKK